MSLRQCSQNVIFNSFQWKKRSGRSQCVLAPARGLSVVPVLPSEQLGPAAFNATDAAACGALGAAPPVLGFSGSRVLARSPRPAAAAPRGTGAAAWERGWERGWAGGGVPGEGGHVSRVLKDEVTSGGCGDSWGALAWRQRWGGGGGSGAHHVLPRPTLGPGTRSRRARTRRLVHTAWGPPPLSRQGRGLGASGQTVPRGGSPGPRKRPVLARLRSGLPSPVRGSRAGAHAQPTGGGTDLCPCLVSKLRRAQKNHARCPCGRRVWGPVREPPSGLRGRGDPPTAAPRRPGCRGLPAGAPATLEAPGAAFAVGDL